MYNKNEEKHGSYKPHAHPVQTLLGNHGRSRPPCIPWGHIRPFSTVRHHRADSRTLRKDIEQLVEFGVDIVKERRVQNLYHVATRHFEAPEVKLLIDAVQSARFITSKKSKKLIKRLTTFIAPGDAVLLERHAGEIQRTVISR